MNILILGTIHRSTIERLSLGHHVISVSNLPVDLDDPALTGTTVVVIRSPFTLQDKMLARMPRLQLVIRAGAGTDGIDLSGLKSRHISFHRLPHASSSVAEHAFGLLLGVMRQVVPLNDSLREGQWRKADALGSEVAGKTMTVVGFGQVGRRIAHIAHAFGANVLIADRSPWKAEKQAAAKQYGASFLPLHDALSASELLMLSCPLNDETRGIIGHREIQLLRPPSYVVNVARGGILDHEAVRAALEVGHLRGVGVDVFPIEPPVDAAFLHHPLVLATPHIGAQTEEASLRIGRSIEKILQRHEAVDMCAPDPSVTGL